MKPLLIIAMLAITIGLCAPAVAKPIDTQYTLDACYRLALEHAEQIGIAQEAVAIAEYTRKQALSVLMPKVTAFSNYRRYTEDQYASGSLLQPEWEGSYGVKLGQSVTLNGRELTALRIAERGLDKSRADLDATTEAYLYAVASAFFDVAKTQQSVGIARANVQRLKLHKDAVTTRLKLGDVAKTELFRIEAELASAEADLIQARNDLQLARNFLARLVGLNAAFDIVEPETTMTNLDTGQLEQLKKLASDNRAELKSLQLAEVIAAKQVDFTKGAYWPRLSVEGAWTRLEQEPDPMLEESTHVGASLSFDLFDGGLRRSQVSEARALQKQARLTLEDNQRSVAIEVEEAWRTWQTQQSVISSFESQWRFAKENYEAFTRLFEHGMANSVDMMDANTLLVTSERRLSESRYNLQLAVLRMERSAGVFLSSIRGRLSLNPAIKQE